MGDALAKFNSVLDQARLLIIDTACELFDVEKAMLVSTSQSRKLSFVRGAIIMYA